MDYPCLRLLAAAGLGAAQLTGCGLISSDVTDFNLAFEKNFTIDASGWQVDTAQASVFDMNGKLQSVSCSSDPSVCSKAVAMACPSGCTGSCSADDTCEMSLDVSLSQSVNLVMEKPELSSVDSSVLKVSVDSVTYDIKSNTLNVDTPPILVYVGPMAALKPSDASVQEIAALDPVPAGWTTTGQAVKFTAAGKTALGNIMATFKTPFNVLVGSSLTIGAGDPLPTGKLEAVVHINGHAGL